MKKLLLPVLVSFLMQTGIAQDNLTPVRSLFDLYSFSIDNMLAVKKTLLEREEIQGPSHRFMYLVIPSFESEYMIEVISDTEGYFIKYRFTEENIWYSGKIDDIVAGTDSMKVTGINKKLCPYSAEKIMKLLQGAIINTRHQIKTYDNFAIPEVINIMFSFDGEDHFYGMDPIGTGTAWGMVHSQYKDSNTYRLNSIMERMIEMVQKETDDTVTFTDNLIRDIEELTSLFPS